MGGDSGVFVGIERPDWALAQPPSARSSVYAVTGDNVSVAAGRISFVLGLQGPCSSVDTACSSALAALHGGSHAVRALECGDALALAVSLKLVPHTTLGVASAGLLSTDGRCKTLDARANGYARSEGVGALVLRPCGEEAAPVTTLCGSRHATPPPTPPPSAPPAPAPPVRAATDAWRPPALAAARLGVPCPCRHSPDGPLPTLACHSVRAPS